MLGGVKVRLSNPRRRYHPAKGLLVPSVYGWIVQSSGNDGEDELPPHSLNNKCSCLNRTVIVNISNVNEPFLIGKLIKH